MAKTAPADPQTLARIEGAHLISPLQREIQTLTVETPEDYLNADLLLARVRNALALWDQKMSPILTPAKVAADAAKATLQAAKGLHSEIAAPLETMQTAIKDAMKAFKVEERRQLVAEQAERDQEAQRLADEAAKKALALTAARTPQMKARLEKAREAILEAQAVVETTVSEAPIMGSSSSARTITKLRITDPLAFLAAVRDYQPKAGIYQLKTPPLSVVTHRTTRTGERIEDGSPLESILAELTRIWREQPGVVRSWVGVEEYEDIIIAGR